MPVWAPLHSSRSSRQAYLKAASWHAGGTFCRAKVILLSVIRTVVFPSPHDTIGTHLVCPPCPPPTFTPAPPSLQLPCQCRFNFVAFLMPCCEQQSSSTSSTTTKKKMSQTGLLTKSNVLLMEWQCWGLRRTWFIHDFASSWCFPREHDGMYGSYILLKRVWMIESGWGWCWNGQWRVFPDFCLWRSDSIHFFPPCDCGNEVIALCIVAFPLWRIHLAAN